VLVRICFMFLVLLFSGTQVLVAQQEDRELTQKSPPVSKIRTALVIGNSDYVKASKLANPTNDATDMVRTLAGLGFNVISGTNLSLREMTERVREFGDSLKANGGVGLFYYAGHGVQVGGRNYLIPVEADVPREDEIDFNALNVDLVLRKMASANNGLNIVILDACRNNPFSRSWSRSSDEGGLAQITAPTGTFIAYATSPDRTASDGGERNGLYTAELLKVLNSQPDLKIEDAFKQVTIAVDRASGGKQVPWTSSSLRGEFYFKLDGKDVKGTFSATITSSDPAGAPTTPTVSGAATSELDAWNKIKESSEAQDFAKFLNQYPNGIFANAARTRLVGLTGGALPEAANPASNPYANIFESLRGGAADTAVFYVDGSSRVQMKIATSKQDTNVSMGVMGIGGGFKMLDTLNNARAPLRVKASNPEFEYTAPANINVADVAFVVRLNSKSGKREIQTMQKTFSGYKAEDMIRAVFEETSLPAPPRKKVYRIKFSQALPPGEYAIVVRPSFADIAGFEGNTVGGGVYFDFGVDR
jgi:hypothetical protein